MSNHGLHLFDIGLVRHSRRAFPDLDEIRGKKDYRKWQSGAQVIASDVLYLRDFVNEKNNGRIFSTDDLQSLLKMIVIFESYDLYDCIIEILNEFKEILSSVLDAYTLVNTITYHKKRYRKYEKYINKANKLKK